MEKELPPRARRIRDPLTLDPDKDGTTSACAENTIGKVFPSHGNRNYLRVRGEYRWCSASRTLNKELPPRARRILAGPVKDFAGNGTTSACAENTSARPEATYSWWNYLRVRGEYPFTPWLANRPMELPPRARRIHKHFPLTLTHIGTTSACAENTVGA